MNQLKRLRAERRLSQAKLAALADIDPSTVNQIERGARDASPATLRKLAEALEVSIAELLEDNAPKEEAPSSAQPSFNGLLEEERRSIYLSADLNVARAKAGWARWVAREVHSFGDPPQGSEDVGAKEMFHAWSRTIDALRSDAQLLGGVWDGAFGQVSGQSMPAEEKDLLEELRRTLQSYRDTVEKLAARFGEEWAAFRRQHAEATLPPTVSSLMEYRRRHTQSPPTDSDRSSDAV